MTEQQRGGDPGSFHPPAGLIRRFASRNRAALVVGVVIALVSSGTAAAVSYLVLGTSNTAGTTTTLRSGVNAAVLQVTNTNSVGGTSARGLSITVPTGRAPIVVNSAAGKATNLNADRLDGIDSTGFIRGPVSGWHEVGAAGEPVFQDYLPGLPAWRNYLNGYNTAGFYRDPLGTVHLKGLVQSTIPQGGLCESVRIFTLPSGYRPAATTIAPTLHNDSTARIDIMTNGYVTICTPDSWNQDEWFSLDGITFRAGQ